MQEGKCVQEVHIHVHVANAYMISWLKTGTVVIPFKWQTSKLSRDFIQGW